MEAACPRPGIPGLTLGAVLGEAALAGRDKLTILADAASQCIGRTGSSSLWRSPVAKLGKGIVPVALEPLDTPGVYETDRLFVYLRQNGALDTGVQALAMSRLSGGGA